MELLATTLRDETGGLGHLPPSTVQVPKRFRHHEPGLFGQLVQNWVVGVLLTERGDVEAAEQRPGPSLGGVTKRPSGFSVGGGHCHLDGVLDAVAVPGLLDEAD